MKNAASVHRFRDFVACRVGSGETVYLSPKAAKELAKALNAVARSVKTEEFTESHCGTAEIKDGDQWHSSARGCE